MHNPLLTLLLLAAFVVFDLWRSLATGRALGWPAGVITRKGQPQRFWRHVYADWAVLAFCAITFLALMLRPALFQ